MGAMSFICIYVGCFPELLYQYLPYSEYVLAKVPSTFSDIYVKYSEKLFMTIQMLSFTVIAFIVALPTLKRTDRISIDFDWIYRKLFRYIYIFTVEFVDFIYNTVNKATMILVQLVSAFLIGQFQYFCM